MNCQIESLLPIIINDKGLHARWLNTLSFLEYIGFRKIVKSQQADRLNLETLGHAVEEGRHALLLKKLAVKIGGQKFNNYFLESLLCGSEAEKYFQSLDRSCEDFFRNQIDPKYRTRLVYLYVTWLIELRAIHVYGLYQKALSTIGIKPSLNGLLAEEDQHLAAVEQELSKSDINFNSNAAELRSIESALYQNFLKKLTHDVMSVEAPVGTNL